MEHSFSEHRLLYFSPPPGGAPAGAPGTGPKGPEAGTERLDPIKTVTELVDKLDSDEAADVVRKALTEVVGKGQEEVNTILVAAVNSAAQLEYKYKKSEALSAGKSAEQAQAESLAEVNADFQKIFADPFQVDSAGELVSPSASKPERKDPTTQGEKLFNDMQDGIAEATKEGLTMGERLTAIMKVWAAFQGILSRIGPPPTFSEPYESPKAKADKEAHRKHQERIAVRKEIRDAIPPETLDSLKAQKESEKATADNDLNTAKTNKKNAEDELADAQKELASPPAGLDATQLTAHKQAAQAKIDAARQKVNAATTEVENKEKLVGKLTTTIEEIVAMKEEVKDVPGKLRKAIVLLGNALKQHPAPTVKQLGEQLSTMQDPEPATGMQYKLVDSSGNNLLVDEKLKTAFKDHFGKEVTEEEMGMNAAGLIVDTDQFVKFFSADLKTSVEQASNVAHNKKRADVFDAITDSTEGEDPNDPEKKVRVPNDPPNPFNEGGAEQIIVAIEDSTPEGKWIQGAEVDGDTGSITYVNGEVWFQAESENGSGTEDATPGVASRLKISPLPATWEKLDSPPKYFSGGPDGELKEIPEGGDATLLGKMYTFSSEGGINTWKEKNFRDLSEQEGWSWDGSEPKFNELYQKALSPDNEGKWIEGEDDSGDKISFFYDGEKLYKQPMENPGYVSVADGLDFIRTSRGSNFFKHETDSYFDGSQIVKFEGDMADSGKRKRSHEYKDHKWGPKATKDIVKEGCYDHLSSEADDAVASPGEWKAEASGVEYFFDGDSNLYKMSADHKTCERFDVDEYVKNDTGSWEAMTDQYVDSAGNVVDLPDNTDSYKWGDPEEHMWNFNEDNAIANLTITPANPAIVARQKTGLKGLLSATDWTDNSEFPLWEGIRVGDMIYLQEIADPKRIYVTDLKAGTSKEVTNKYFDGTALRDLPSDRNRTEYNQDTHTWGELENPALVSKKREEDGKEVLGGNHGSLDIAVGTTSTVSGDRGTGTKEQVINVKYNRSTYEWEWRFTANAKANDTWKSVQNGGPTTTSANAARQETYRQIREVCSELQRINESVEEATA